MAFERLALAARSRKTEVEVEAERLRTALLSSLSHDMRTPLASIQGAASTLLQDGAPPDEGTRCELASTILEESQRMSRLVANLLEMIRVESGDLEVQKEWQLLSDVVGVALLRIEEQLSDHPVTTEFPARSASGRGGRNAPRAGVRQSAGERRQTHSSRHADRSRSRDAIRER